SSSVSSVCWCCSSVCRTTPCMTIPFAFRPSFFTKHPSPTETYTLSLHDALPISGVGRATDLVAVLHAGTVCCSQITDVRGVAVGPQTRFRSALRLVPCIGVEEVLGHHQSAAPGPRVVRVGYFRFRRGTLWRVVAGHRRAILFSSVLFRVSCGAEAGE